MFTSDAVLSGGIRRSATSVIFEADDEDMLNAKINIKVDKKWSFDKEGQVVVGGKTYITYSGKVQYEGIKYEVTLKDFEYEMLDKTGTIFWKHIFPQRARSNNSILLIRDETTLERFEYIVEKTKEFGEPGFVFGNHRDQLFNPCFEIGFISVTNDGVCGVQFCNLTTQNGRKIKTKKDFYECCVASAIIGTLQAGYTNFPYLSKAAEELTKDEALLGCSITGVMDNAEVLLNYEVQKEMADVINNVNSEWAKKIGINPAARTTCIKPEGTSSLVFGCGSGIHFHHAKRYFRRVQCNKLDPVYKFFKQYNSHACESSVWSENGTDDVISFPIQIAESVKVKSDVTALEHLEMIKSTQKNWVLTGSTVFNKKPITNNVSCTVIVKENEWKDVTKFIFDNREFFSAVSLLPSFGDKLYPQAPMEAIVSDEDAKIWDKIVSQWKHIKYTDLKESEDKTNLSSEIVCAGGACELVTV